MRALAVFLLGLAAVWADVSAHAADYPSRPVTLIVAFTPGGPSDVLARILGKKLEQILGQPFVVENRPGAGGNIAAELAARAAPDGYTLLMGNNSILATNASLYAKVGFDAEKDFAPISLIGSQANILVVNPALPAKSMGELIALAKANPGKLNHASGGTATLLALELFKAMAGVDIASIPFRGGAPAVTGVMSGDTQLIFADLATANAGMQSGKLRTLAVTTLKRAPRLPDVPTIDESGVPGYDVATWIGAFAPAGTPKSIVGKIEADIKQALAAPEVKTKLEALSMEIRSGASAEMRDLLAGDIGKWGRLVKDRNIQIAQ
jgi:tripartite-type tricarboxylate transporter receptor subunit TctC